MKMGYTPLHWATVKGHCEAAALLIAANADPNITDKVTSPCTANAMLSVLWDGQYGQIPLHFVDSKNHCEVAQVLLTAGANVDAKDNVTSSRIFLKCC